MFIIEPPNILHTYSCKRILCDYLLYECNLPLLSIADDEYIFADTPLLRDALSSLPWLLKLKIKLGL